MADLALKRQSDGSLDLQFDESTNDFATSEGLENAIAISIGTFARDRKLPENKANLKALIGGWWADALDEKGTLGGYIYEAFPGKLNQATAASVKALVLESLQWLKEDGVANDIACETSIEGDILKCSVTVSKPNGGEETFEFEKNWAEVENGI